MEQFSLYNGIPNPVRVLDMNGEIVFANERAEQEGLHTNIVCIREGIQSSCQSCLETCNKQSLVNTIVQVREKIYRVDQNRIQQSDESFLVETFTDVTALYKTQANVEAILETTKEGFIMVDESFCLEKCNSAFSEMVEFSLEELEGMSLFDLVVGQSVSELTQQITKREKEKNRTYRLVLKTKSGKEKTVEVVATTHFDASQKQMGSFAFIRDITEQEAQLKQLHNSQAEFEQLVESVPVGIGVLDNFTLARVNRNFFTMLGYNNGDSEQFLGKSVMNKALFSAKNMGEIINLVRALETSTSTSGELWMTHKDGGEIPVEVRLSYVEEEGKRKTFIVIQDISERKTLEAQLKKMATTDNLTRLANRRTATEFLERACETAKRQNEEVAVLFLDVDHFKQVNDTYGHRAGDDVLKVVAEKLGSVIRIKGQDIVARWGGEEFVVILTKTQQENTLKKAEEIRKILEETEVSTFDKDGNPVIIKRTASIGIARGNEPEKLLNLADQLMYRAKESGRNRICFESESGEIETFQTA